MGFYMYEFPEQCIPLAEHLWYYLQYNLVIFCGVSSPKSIQLMSR